MPYVRLITEFGVVGEGFAFELGDWKSHALDSALVELGEVGDLTLRRPCLFLCERDDPALPTAKVGAWGLRDIINSEMFWVREPAPCF